MTVAADHWELAEWLMLIAAVVFLVAGALTASRRPDPSAGALVPIGLALMAIAWLVL